MALSPASFAVSQTIGLPSIINIADNSTGTDSLVTDRKVYLTDVYGNYITAAGTFVAKTSTDWPYANTSIAIDCLKNDMALNIEVDWLNNVGTILYTKTVLYDFTLYGLQALFALTQTLSSAPQTMQDQNFWSNKVILRGCIDDADNAVTIGNNQAISQAALDRAAIIIAKQNIYF